MATNRRRFLATVGLGGPALMGAGKVLGAEIWPQPPTPIKAPIPDERLAPSGPRHISVLVGGKMPEGVLLGDVLKRCDDSLYVYSTGGCGEFLWEGCYRPSVAVLSITIDDDFNGDFRDPRGRPPWRCRGSREYRAVYQRYARIPLAMATLRAFYDSYPRIPVIVVLDSSKRKSVLQAFRCGARGVLTNGDSVENLCKGIRAVHNRLLWVDPEAASVVEGLLSPGGEQRLLHCISEGMSKPEIYFNGGLSRNATEMYMLRIFDKLGVLNRLSTAYWM